jgi:hypothetical protein
MTSAATADRTDVSIADTGTARSPRPLVDEPPPIDWDFEDYFDARWRPDVSASGNGYGSV